MDSTQEKSTKGLLGFFSHPIVGILGSVASVVGLVLAVYFYFLSTRARDLTYHIHPVRTPIVQSTLASDIAVTFKGSPIKGDLTAAQVAVWNRGKEPIRAEDILKPIFLQTSDHSPILDASLRKSSRDVTGFRLDTSQMANGRIGFYWRILENNDGAVVQILYAGKPDMNLTLDGVLVGQRTPNQASFSRPLSTLEDQYQKMSKYGNLSGWVLILFSIILLALLCSSIYRYRRTGSKDKDLVNFYFLAFVTLGFLIWGVKYLFSYRVPGPPFGF